MVVRPSWEQYFMDIAELVSSRSTCVRRQIGAVLIRDKQIISTGYNGAPKGIGHCGDQGCLRTELGIPSGERHEICRGVHAEQNAIIQAALHGINTEGTSLFCTHQPCTLCAKLIINAGVRKVLFQGDYPDTLAKELLLEANISLIRWDG